MDQTKPMIDPLPLDEPIMDRTPRVAHASIVHVVGRREHAAAWQLATIKLFFLTA